MAEITAQLVKELRERTQAGMADCKNALVEATNREWMGAIPFTMLILPGGEIAYKHLGEVDPLELKRKIVDILGRTYYK